MKSLRKSIGELEKNKTPDYKNEEMYYDENVKDRQSNRKLREDFAKKSFIFVVFYSISIIALLLLHGFKAIPYTLPVSVLELLVGSTAASVLGLLTIVGIGLFRSK